MLDSAPFSGFSEFHPTCSTEDEAILGKVFPRRLTSGGNFNTRLLFENNRILFSLSFSGIFGGARLCWSGRKR